MEEIKSKQANGHPYVDLELASGALWATMNVGASKPTESGLYFQWGDIVGYKEDQIGKEPINKRFEYSDYRWLLSSRKEEYPKYISPGDKLELEDDAAHIHMGGSWHMPTNEQIKELADTSNTRCDWIEKDDVYGVKITSKKDKSKYIFIPASGYAWDDEIFGIGDIGSLWSSMLNGDNSSYGQRLYFGPKGFRNGFSYRYYGFSIRGVIG